MMNKIGFYTKFKTLPGKAEEFISILSNAAKSVTGVKGCVLYIVNRDLQQQNCIWVTEIWDTKEDHSNSLKMEACQELIARAMPLLDGRPEQMQLEVVSGLNL